MQSFYGKISIPNIFIDSDKNQPPSINEPDSLPGMTPDVIKLQMPRANNYNPMVDEANNLDPI